MPFRICNCWPLSFLNAPKHMNIHMPYSLGLYTLRSYIPIKTDRIVAVVIGSFPGHITFDFWCADSFPVFHIVLL